MTELYNGIPVYLELGEFKDTEGIGGADFMEDRLREAIAAASRVVDSICNRRFWMDAEDKERLYDADRPSRQRFFTDDPVYDARAQETLKIHDLAEFTSLTMDTNGDGVFDQTWTRNSDFVLEPANAVLDGLPFTLIRVRPTGRYTFASSFPAAVKVTGKFGWPAVPPEIKKATNILANRLFKRDEAPFGVATMGLEGHAMRIPRLQYDPDATLLLDQFIRKELFV